MKTVRDILAVKGREVWTLELEATLFDAMKRMEEKEVGALLVADGPKLVGIISIGDLVKSIIADQKFIIEQLERYTTS